jgi:hypothetical protein
MKTEQDIRMKLDLYIMASFAKYVYEKEGVKQPEDNPISRMKLDSMMNTINALCWVLDVDLDDYLEVLDMRLDKDLT